MGGDCAIGTLHVFCGMILQEAWKEVKPRRIKAYAEMCSHNKFYKQENNEESAVW